MASRPDDCSHNARQPEQRTGPHSGGAIAIVAGGTVLREELARGRGQEVTLTRRECGEAVVASIMTPVLLRQYN